MTPEANLWFRRSAWALAAAWIVAAWCSAVLKAQEAPPDEGMGGPSAEQGPAAGPEEPVDPESLAKAALESQEPAAAAPEAPLAPSEELPRIDLWDLTKRGGFLMIPLGLVSLLVVTFGLERLIALRRGKVLPPVLFDGLRRLAGQKGGLDPRRAYALCNKYPSTASRVILAMLIRLGRPQSELEQAHRDANEREAGKLYANVRWLTLAVGIAPLLGLLGTVGGMIQAFFETVHLQPGANRADYLAEGIYKALVTTFAGLSIAIPAALLAHLFEGRIQRLFRELDEFILTLLPQFERFEGRLRGNHEALDSSEFPRNPVARDAAEPARRSPDPVQRL